MHESSLQIHRLNIQYILDESTTSATEEKKRLDRMATEQLARTLGQSLSPLFSRKPGLVLFDKLECELTFDSTHSNRAIVEAWTSEITRVLSRYLQDDTCQAMVYYDTFEDLLSAFLIDLIKGQAWNNWAYRTFDGLKMLPLSAALRTAILDNQDVGMKVLLAMNQTEQRMVVRALGKVESHRVLSTLASNNSDVGVNLDKVARQILSVLDNDLLISNETSASSLYLFLQVNATHRMNCKIQARLIREIVQLKTSLADSAFYHSVNKNDKLAIEKIINTETEIIAGLSPATRNIIINILSKNHEDIVCDTTIDTMNGDAGRCLTLFGGAILLIRFIAELPINKFPGITDDDAICLRMIILAKAMGNERFIDVFNNPVLRELLAVPPTLTVRAATDWAANQPQDRWQDWMHMLADWRRGQWPAKEDKQVLCNRFGIQHLLSERVKGAWLYSVSATNISELNKLNVPASDNKVPVDSRMLRRSLADFHYLRIPLIASMNENIDMALSVMSQSVMRDFSFCLSGFSDSSLSFLYDNFLAFSAQMEKVENGYHVHLGRPSLNVILNMTSLQREQVSLPWHSSLSLSLFPDS